VLNRVGGDLGLLREVVGLFLDACPQSLAELRQAATAGDAAALHSRAHTFKGMVGNFGARDAFAAALRLEMLAREGDLSGASDACAALEGAVERLRPALAALLAEGGPS
jgi:HPt (histidine-containing phosphotransfer) domain-containing protein